MPAVIENHVPDGTPEPRPRTLTSFDRAYGTRSLSPAYPPVKLAGYYRRSLRDEIPPPVLPSTETLALPNAGTIVLVPNPVPVSANRQVFPVSHFEICSYIEEAQRFLATTDLN